MQDFINIVSFNLAAGMVALVLQSLGINHVGFMALTALMAIDFICGVGKSYRKQIPITSRRIKLGVIAKLSVLLIVFSFAIAGKSMGADEAAQSFVAWVIWVFCLSELYSIIGNAYAIKTGDCLPELEVISLIGGRIRNMLKRILDDGDGKYDA